MKIISRKLLRRENGYEVWREITRLEFHVGIIDDAGDPDGTREFADSLQDGDGRLVTLDVAYTPEGGFIGTLDKAEELCVRRSVRAETVDSRDVCSIGFCERDGKWYGWSHRAIYGFQIGDIAKEGDCVCSSGWTDEYLAEHPEEDASLPVGFEAKTVEDAKRMAIAFAQSVS